MTQIKAMISKTKSWEILCMGSVKAHSSCVLMVFSVLSSRGPCTDWWSQELVLMYVGNLLYFPS